MVSQPEGSAPGPIDRSQDGNHRPRIVKLTIQRFRGIEDLTWRPGSGVNVLLGGGDAGKTTILDAIALLLSPSNSTQVGESDYWRRDVENGFNIEGVFSIPDESGVLDELQATAWPWEWDGTDAILPDPNVDPEDPNERDSVYIFRVRGTNDFDLSYEIVQPNGKPDYLPVGVRRKIGLVWLEGDDGSDRDLRLVYGSALDRLLSDRSLRARLASGIAELKIKHHLTEEARENLSRLEVAFSSRALPAGLDVGLTGGRRLSLNALIGLTALEHGQPLPLASWGAGTRRLAALEIAATNQKGTPISVVDEVERGLEPHRQRALMRALNNAGTQAFVTTHSPIVLSASMQANLWCLDTAGNIGPLSGTALKHVERDPEAFLARIAVVAEGITEVGFVGYFLDRALGGLMLEHGVWITDGGGNERSLGLMEDLSRAGIQVAGFVDFEGNNPQRWQRLRTAMGPLLFQWKDGCLEQNVIACLPEESLLELIEDPKGERTGQRLRTIQDRLQAEDKDWPNLMAKAENIIETVCEAASGEVPNWVPSDRRKEFKNHARTWFKNEEGGRELARKCVDLGIWRILEPDLLPFLNAVRRAIGLDEIEGLDLRE